MRQTRQGSLRPNLRRMAGADAVDDAVDDAVNERVQWSRRQRVFDAAVAVVLTAYAAAAALTSDEYPITGWRTAAFMIVAGGGLAFRRRSPTVAFAVTIGALTVLAVVVAPFQAGSSLLIAMVAAYSATAYAARRWVIGIGAVALVLAQSLPGRFGGPPSGAFVALVLGLAGAAGLVVRRMRSLSAANSALAALVQRESEANTQAAVDEERARIARELHDILSHSLAVVALQTGAAEHAWGKDDERALASLSSARATSLEAIDQLKTLLAVVRDEHDSRQPPLPTLLDLPTLAERSSREGFTIDLTVHGNERPVSPQVAASVYRVAQEGIANALKHSGSSGCRMCLTYGSDNVTIVVDDDGGGSGPAGGGSQLGLPGLKERAAIFGGWVNAAPLAGGGWRLEAEFPG